MSDMAESKNRDVSPTRAGDRARSVRASAARVSSRAHSLDFALGQPELRLLGAGAHDARGTTGLPGGDLERRGVSNWWHRVSCAMRLSRVQVRETRTWRPCDRRPGAATARARGGETRRWKTPFSFLCARARDTNAGPERARLRDRVSDDKVSRERSRRGVDEPIALLPKRRDENVAFRFQNIAFRFLETRSNLRRTSKRLRSTDTGDTSNDEKKRKAS